jgi:hypothetical protein
MNYNCYFCGKSIQVSITGDYFPTNPVFLCKKCSAPRQSKELFIVEKYHVSDQFKVRSAKGLRQDASTWHPLNRVTRNRYYDWVLVEQTDEWAAKEVAEKLINNIPVLGLKVESANRMGRFT